MKENPEEDKEIDLPILLLEDINVRGISNANTTSKKSPAKKIETQSKSESEFEASEDSNDSDELEEISDRKKIRVLSKV